MNDERVRVTHGELELLRRIVAAGVGGLGARELRGAGLDSVAGKSVHVLLNRLGRKGLISVAREVRDMGSRGTPRYIYIATESGKEIGV